MTAIICGCGRRVTTTHTHRADVVAAEREIERLRYALREAQRR